MPDFLNLDKLGGLNLDNLRIKLRTFHGFEEISRLYRYELKADIPQNKVDLLTPGDVLGEQIAFSINDDQSWLFGGIVLSIEFGEVLQSNRRVIELTVVPDLWKLTQIIDTQSFPSKKISALFQSIASDYPITQKIIDKTTGDSHFKRENPVQYDENLMRFLARIMDEESIFYYFNPAKSSVTGREQVVLGDALDDYQQLFDPREGKSADKLKMGYDTSASIDEPTEIIEWRRQLNFRPSYWSIQDYDYKNSTDFNMRKTAPTSEGSGDKDQRKFQRAAGFLKKSYGDAILDNRSKREARQREYVRAKSYCPSLRAGGFFSFDGHDDSSEDGDYVVTSIEHLVFDREDGRGEEYVYQNWFTCVLKQDDPAVHCPFQADQAPQGDREYGEMVRTAFDRDREGEERLARRKRRRGDTSALRPPSRPNNRPPETAFVCDANGNYKSDGDSYGAVYTDTDEGYGRVLIRFPWEEDDDFQSGRWVRVAQMVAGNNWGGKFLPRVGDEVIVMYIDGTERKPMVVGMVYNDQHLLTNQSESDIWILQNETRSPFNDGASKNAYSASCATDRLAKPDSVRDTDSNKASTGASAKSVLSLQDPNVSGFRTRTNKSVNADNSDGYNELLFVDKPDAQEIYIRAERDLNIKVQNDLNIEVGRNKNEIIRGDYYRVANVGQAVNPYMQNLPPNPDYPSLSDGGVIRSVTDGINYDYDKVWQVWTVENFESGSPCEELGSSHAKKDAAAKYYRVTTETFADEDNWTIGDTREKFMGNYEEYFEGKKLEVVTGSNADNPATICTRVTGKTDETFDGITNAKFKGTSVSTTFEGVSVTEYYIGSNFFGFHLGGKEEIMIAGGLEIFLGLAAEVFIGNKFSLFVGNLLDIHAGAKKEIGPDEMKTFAKWTSYVASCGITAAAGVTVNSPCITLN